ncbi:MAG TPA: hypothetical protein VFE45_12650, partial [Coriobacteriia bacterium]|nr:hypothetical protein [Coriobacteriia bacterium]
VREVRSRGPLRLVRTYGHSAMTAFADPFVAALLGLVLGVLLMLVSRRAVALVTPDDPTRGFALVALFMLGRLIIVMAALAAYFFLARAGFLVFAAVLITSFIISLALEALESSRSFTSSRTSG